MGLAVVIKADGSAAGDLAQASRIEVYERMGETTWYSIRYAEDISGGDLVRQLDSRLQPGVELAILADTGNELSCLVKGPVFSQQIHFQHGGQGSWVEVRGGDNTIVMDREHKAKKWPNVTDGEAVIGILGTYNLIPDVDSTKTRHLETKHTLVQCETDLRFIRRLARRNGCKFWISCAGEGIETGHFKRPVLESSTETELKINMEFPSIQSLDLTWDVERPTSIEGVQLDLNTKGEINGAVGETPQSPLGTDSLMKITGDKRSMHLAAPGDDAGNLQGRSEGALIESDWFIRATCTTSTHNLGRVIRANTMALIRGAGSRHSGYYYVAAVRHIIDETAHLMELELIRNAWNSDGGGPAGALGGIV